MLLRCLVEHAAVPIALFAAWVALAPAAARAGGAEAEAHLRVDGRLTGHAARGDLEDAWIHAVPASSAPPDTASSGGFYGFPAGFGIWYRPVPVDGDGRFELRLPPGRYHVRAGARGYRDALVQVRVAKEGEGALPPLRLEWQGVGRLRVRALFADGTPVSCRPVRVGLRWGQGQEAESAAATDDEGYLVLLIRPGAYRVRLLEPRAGTAPLDVTAADGRLCDVVLRVGAGAYVTGRALDAAGEPVAGAAITALPIDGPRGAPPDTSRWSYYGADWHTGPEGDFAVGPLAPGWHVLAIRRPGLARGLSAPLRLDARGRVEGIEVRLGEPDPGEGDLVVRVLRGPGGGPVSGAEVTVAPRRGVPAAAVPGGARTNEHGFAGLSGVPAGDLEVEAVLSDPSSGVVVAGRARTGLRHGQRQELQVSIRRAAALVGRVTGFAGRPVAGATIRIRPRGTDDEDYAPIASAADGSFTLPLLFADEPYELRVDAPGHAGRTIAVRPGEVRGRLDVPLTVAR